jgi:hypothetical protein
MVAASREALGLQDEWVFEVPGLPIPESIYADGSVQNTSAELFLQRARRAHVGFSATPENYPAIVRICQLVEGMPLAIELAAAWVRTLCGEIGREIEQGGFLTVMARDIRSYDPCYCLRPFVEFTRKSISCFGFLPREASGEVRGRGRCHAINAFHAGDEILNSSKWSGTVRHA